MGARELNIDALRLHDCVKWTGGECYCNDAPGEGAQPLVMLRKRGDASSEFKAIHWMDGAPDYFDDIRHAIKRHKIIGADASAYLPGECLTILDTGPMPDVLFDTDGEYRWHLIGDFAVNPEAECGWCGPGTEAHDEHNGPDPKCEMCEGDGVIDIGDGYAEWCYIRVLDCDRADTDEVPPAPGPGRLEGEGRIGAYLDSLDADSECGNVDGPGHYRLISGELNRERRDRWQDGERDDLLILMHDEASELEGIAGAIIRTNSDGFISTARYTDQKELDAAWSTIGDECDDFESSIDAE